MKSIFNFNDPRWFQIGCLSTFFVFGVSYLQWEPRYWKLLTLFCTTTLWQGFYIYLKKAPLASLLSAWISALGLNLLLQTDSWLAAFMAGSLAILVKFVIQDQGKHFLNPANFALVSTVLLSGAAWISPGQWGSGPSLVLMFGVAGWMILQKVGRWETGLAFLITYFSIEYAWNVLHLGWPADVLLPKMSSGSLALFTCFMITDPVSTPRHIKARILFSILVAAFAFYLGTFKFVNAAPIYALFFLSPLTPLLNRWKTADMFQWNPSSVSTSKIKLGIMVLGITFFSATQSYAFCGFFVAKAGASLFNNKSEVIMVRDGNKNTITMANDFKGNVRDFAMVIPVPVVLKREDIRIMESSVFKSLDDYSAPRLVEYHDYAPCRKYYDKDLLESQDIRLISSAVNEAAPTMTEKKKVVIEAQYEIGEYSIMILSASESSGLKDWLNENGYQIPPKGEEVLEPYIKNKLKFFVVKVNLGKVQMKDGFVPLRPLQISFTHDKFMLPIRLGMANSKGYQDLVVYAFSKKGRIETVNYRTSKMPTGNYIPNFVKDRFGEFYRDLYLRHWQREGKNAVMLEYAWEVTPSWSGMKCDPCVGPPPMTGVLNQAGVSWAATERVFFTRLHVRYGREEFPQDLIFQETMDQNTFQSRYVIHWSQKPEENCPEAKEYMERIHQRRMQEKQEMEYLTGWDLSANEPYFHEFEPVPEPEPVKENKPVQDKNKRDTLWIDTTQGNAPIKKIEKPKLPPKRNEMHTPMGGGKVLFWLLMMSTLWMAIGKSLGKKSQ